MKDKESPRIYHIGGEMMTKCSVVQWTKHWIKITYQWENWGNQNVNFLVMINIPWFYKMFMLDITLHKMLTLEEAG